MPVPSMFEIRWSTIRRESLDAVSSFRRYLESASNIPNMKKNRQSRNLFAFPTSSDLYHFRHTSVNGINSPVVDHRSISRNAIACGFLH
jgi:hypothetical protein